MASVEGAAETAAPVEQTTSAPETTATPAAAPTEETTAEPAAPAEEKPSEEKPAEEKKENSKAERLERRKQQRKAAREAAKQAKANGEPPKPKAQTAGKVDKAGDIVQPQGAAPKISVAKLPSSITAPELTGIFATHGQVLRAEVSKRRGRPTIGTIVFNTHQEVKKAVNALHNKYKCNGESDPITIQYSKDSAQWGETVKKVTDEVADTLKQYNYKPSLLRNKATKDFINRTVFMRRKAPAKEVLTAALLVSAAVATPEELVKCNMVDNAAPVLQLLRDDKEKAPAAKPESAGRGAKEQSAVKAPPKLEKTFDAVVPKLDKLEKERWNRMAKANLRLSERYRFRFVDILATPSLELWRWMVEDCDITPAEAGTCFAILQTYYGFSK